MFHSSQQDAAPPPPPPSFIYRGHQAPVHALEFFAENRLLLSGDEQGWVFVWDLWTRRAMLQWRAHGTNNKHEDHPSAILAVRVLALHPPWSHSDEKGTEDRDSTSTAAAASAASAAAATTTTPQHGPAQCLILTHGRDHRIHVWDIREALANALLSRNQKRRRRRREAGQQGSTATMHGEGLFAPEPIFTLPVSALNFCKMNVVGVAQTVTAAPRPTVPKDDNNGEVDMAMWPGGTGYRQILVAIPSPLDANLVDVYDLLKPAPVFQRVDAAPPPPPSSSPGPAGMAKGHGAAMAIRMIVPPHNKSSAPPSQDEGGFMMRMLVGYEDGSVNLFQGKVDASTTGSPNTMSLVWTFQGHREPVLSVAVSADQRYALSCGSDNRLIRYNLVNDTLGVPETLQQSLKANGMAEVQIRDDDKIVALAGWDGKIRIYSFKTLMPLAVLTCHRESLYCIALASVVSEASTLRQYMGTAQARSAGIGGDDSSRDSDSSESSEEDEEDQRRLQQYTRQHWLAAGGKENRISQWQIY